jgi:hypothetical protein
MVALTSGIAFASPPPSRRLRVSGASDRRVRPALRLRIGSRDGDRDQLQPLCRRHLTAKSLLDALAPELGAEPPRPPRPPGRKRRNTERDGEPLGVDQCW